VGLFVYRFQVLEIFPDSAPISADCGRQSSADQAALDLLFALLCPHHEQMPRSGEPANLGRRLRARQLRRFRAGPGGAVVLRPGLVHPPQPRAQNHQQLAWRILHERRLVGQLPAPAVLHDDQQLAVAILLPGLAFVIAVNDIAGGEMGVVEMRAGRNEDTVDIAAGKGRARLVESALADPKVDRQDDATGLRPDHRVVERVRRQHPVVHQRQRRPGAALVLRAPEHHLRLVDAVGPWTRALGRHADRAAGERHQRGVAERKRVAAFVQPRVGLAPGDAPVGADRKLCTVGEEGSPAFKGQKCVATELSVVEGQHLLRSRHRHVAHVRPPLECRLSLSPDISAFARVQLQVTAVAARLTGYLLFFRGVDFKMGRGT